MALTYKHGTYGNFADSITQPSTQSGTVAVYVGTAPVNLVRGWAAAGVVNAPVKLSEYSRAQRTVGYSDNWESFSLCEAVKAHFDNTIGNVGPIIVVNVLNPELHKKTGEASAVTLTFVNGRATIQSDTIILDTLAIADKVEGTDYTVDYDYTRRLVLIDAVDGAITGNVEASYSEVDPSAVKAADIVGGVTAGGVYTGLGCVGLVYPELNMIPNIIAAPGWSDKPEVYQAMVRAGDKINGHWYAFIHADIPLVKGDGDKIDTIAAARQWQTEYVYTHEKSKVFWPRAVGTDGNIYHLSTLGTWLMARVDAANNGIPMESPSNKALPAVKQYFGPESGNRGFDQQAGNDLNEKGITTTVYWGGSWVLWGPHTAAYTFGGVADKRSIFDNSVRMMMYILNSFQQEHALTIDQPMTRAMADTIKNREQEKADALAGIGALIGSPVVEFSESENSTEELTEGNFVWSFRATPTPPFKSGTMGVAYTDAGFSSYFEGGE